AILPQQQTVPPGLTVSQLVSLGRAPYQNWWEWELDATGKQKVEEAMIETGVLEFRHRPVAQLSGGEKQRVFLALALAQNPKVLLLDEPTTYLDIHYQLQLLDLLKSLNQRQNLAIITVLHDVNLAARYSDRLALLRQGELLAVGTPEEILTPAHLMNAFEVEVVVLETPVGIQICPLSATNTAQTNTTQTSSAHLTSTPS
ncbi:MAG: ABC transporter ATP-binding protein, partial [Microcoleaceae cyanobacterium]